MKSTYICMIPSPSKAKKVVLHWKEIGLLFGGRRQVESWEGFEAGSSCSCWAHASPHSGPVQISADKMRAAVLLLVLGLAACSEARSTGDTSQIFPIRTTGAAQQLTSCELSKLTFKTLSPQSFQHFPHLSCLVVCFCENQF